MENKSDTILLANIQAEVIKSYSLTMKLSLPGAGTAIGSPRTPAPVALDWGVGVLGRAESAGRGAVVVARRVSPGFIWLFCLCLEASVLLFLTSVWLAAAAVAGESEEEQGQSHNQRLDCQLED